MKMERWVLAAGLGVAAFLAVPQAQAGSKAVGVAHGKAIVTVMPAKGREVAAEVAAGDL